VKCNVFFGTFFYIYTDQIHFRYSQEDDERLSAMEMDWKSTKYTARYIITWKSDKLITTTNLTGDLTGSRDPHLSANEPLDT